MHPIFLVVGPPAVGKSTASRAVAAHFPRGIHIPIDDLRAMVVSGSVVPGATWSDDLIQQITLARTSAIQMALAYHHAGFAVVIDDFADPLGLVEYQALRPHPQLTRILLYPSQEEAHRRNFQRAGMSPARDYIDDGIRIVYRFLPAMIDQLAHEGWKIVDSSTFSVEETVAIILQQAQHSSEL